MPQPAAHSEIRKKRGDTFALALPVVNPDGTPKDLSAAMSVRYGWARGWDGGPVAFSLTLGAPDIQIQTPVGGTVPNLLLIKVPDLVLAEMEAGDYVDEIEVVDAGANRATVWWGPVKLEQDVMR